MRVTFLSPPSLPQKRANLPCAQVRRRHSRRFRRFPTARDVSEPFSQTYNTFVAPSLWRSSPRLHREGLSPLADASCAATSLFYKSAPKCADVSARFGAMSYESFGVEGRDAPRGGKGRSPCRDRLAANGQGAGPIAHPCRAKKEKTLLKAGTSRARLFEHGGGFPPRRISRGNALQTPLR